MLIFLILTPKQILLETHDVGSANVVNEGEIFACNFVSATLFKHIRQGIAQAVEIQNIVCSITFLRIRQLIGAPVATLLLFAEVNFQNLTDERLQTVAIGICPCKTRGNFGAENVLNFVNIQVFTHDRDIKSGIVEDFLAVWVGQEFAQVWAAVIVFAGREVHQVDLATFIANLHYAKTVAIPVM